MPVEELRHTISDARGAAEALNRRLEGRLEAADERLVEHVRSTLRRLEEVVDATMAYERATGPLRRRSVDLGDIVRMAVELHAGELGADGRVDIGALPTVDGDHVQLLALFRPLIENAIKYAHPERPLRVRVHSRPEGPRRWLIVVEDNGVGILATDIERVFHMYERGEAGRSPGQGAGLAAAGRIAKAHGGRVWAEPRTEGAAIVVDLPAER